MKACDAILTWPAYYNLVGIQKVIISFVKWIPRIVYLFDSILIQNDKLVIVCLLVKFNASDKE